MCMIKSNSFSNKILLELFTIIMFYFQERGWILSGTGGSVGGEGVVFF